MSLSSKRQSALGRRAFLKAAMSIGVAIASEPLLPSAAHAQSALDRAASAHRPFRIGVVFPDSRLYPALGKSLIAGLKLAFAARGNLVGDRVVELLPQMYGDRTGSATKQARVLIQEHHANLLIGVMSSFETAPLKDLLQAHRVPLIATTVGTNVLRPTGQSPYIFRATLNDWQANWFTGAWAADQIGKKAFVATAFYESGYDSAYMFTRGLEHAGGSVLGRYVTHRPREVDTFTPMLAAIKQTKPDLVYAGYSGQQAQDFMRAYADADLAGQIPLVGSSFMLDDSLLAEHGQAALGSISGSTWAPDLDTAENKAFMAAYRAATGRPADPFAVLGYDAARLISDAIDTNLDYAFSGDQLARVLRTRELPSPRGDLVMNLQTQSASTPLYVREVRQRQGRLGNAVIAKVGQVADLDQEAAAVRANLKTGWLNAYLAV